MIGMLSTASHQGQVSLHLQHKAMLYSVDMTLGSLIRKARKAKKWPMQKLADKMDVTKQLVFQWERDKTDPRKHIEALSQHLEVPVEYFYGPQQSPPPLETKIKRLSPARRELLEAMTDTLLRLQDEEELGPTVKKA